MYVEARQQHSCGSGRAAAAPQQKKKKSGKDEKNETKRYLEILGLLRSKE